MDSWYMAEQLEEQSSLARYRLMAQALASIVLECDGRVAVMVLTDSLVKGAGAIWEDSEGLVNYARGIEGVEVGLLLAPAKEGGVRISLRSKGHVVDAGAVCAALGGGGHRGAAGCKLPGTLDEARVRVLGELRSALAVTNLA